MPPFFPSGFNKSAQRAGKGVDAPVDDAGHTLLQLGVRKGDEVAVARLLQLGANPRQLDDKGQSPLYDALAAQNIALVKLLVGRGASFRMEDAAGETPLQWAIAKNAGADFLEQLRGLGAELDFQGANGKSALHAAAASNNTEAVGYLLKNHAAIDTADAEGKAALHAAVESGAHESIKLLLEAGADPLLRTREIKTPLWLAAARGDEIAADMLLALPDVRRTLNDFRSYAEGFTPLMAAVAGVRTAPAREGYGNHLAVAEKLLDLGAHINDRDHQNRHSLFLAVETGAPALVKMLIRRGADVEKAPLLADKGQPMLHRINPVYYRETLVLLAGAGADLDAVDSLGNTALNKAAEGREAEKAKALLDLGADPDLANSYGRRPLDTAASGAAYYTNSYEIAAALLSAGADPNLAPAESMAQSPLQAAARSGRADLVRLLLDHGARVDEPDRPGGTTAWLLAVSASNVEACELLRARGADTAKKDNNLRSVIHYAAQSGLKKQLEEGLNNPALAGQLDAPDSAGSTPLQLAVRAFKLETVRALLAAGANPLAADGAGETAMHHLVRSPSDPMFALFEALPGKKADWNVQSRTEKETPLHVAAKTGYVTIVDRLLKNDADIGLKDVRGWTPLMTATAADQTGAMKSLIDRLVLKRISLDGPQDNAGRSPLHLAVKNTRLAPQSAQLLLDAGASPDVRTPEGETPLHFAVRAGRADLVQLLAMRGANPALANKLGATPLDLARELRRQDLVEPLEQALAAQQKRRPQNRPSAPGP